MRQVRFGFLTLLAALLLGLAPMLTPVGPAGVAAKPNKTCQFTKTTTLWTLKQSCSITETLLLPDGVTLDGKHKTITLVGSVVGFSQIDTGGTGSGLMILPGTTANIRNLNLDERLPDCPHGSDGVREIFFFKASGRVDGTTVSGAHTANDVACSGIIAFGGDGETVDLDHVAINSTTGIFGIHFLRQMSGSVTNSTVRNEQYGVMVGGASVTVEGTTLDHVGHGVFEQGPGGTIHNNTIVGLGAGADSFNGVEFGNGAGGDISGNAISNFRNTASGTGCGVRLNADAGAVTLGTNTFPRPGNTQNICDNRPS